MLNKTKKVLFSFLILTFSTLSAFAQLPVGQEKEEVKKDEHGRQIFDDKKERKGVKYNLVPLPSYDPASKWGISLINLINYYPSKGDLKSPPSTSGAMANYTTNNSWMAGVFNKIYLKEDLWRLTAFGFYGAFNTEMYLSTAPGQEEAPMGLAKVTTNIAIGNFMVERKIFSRVYLGLGYQYNGRLVEGRDSASQELLDKNHFGDEFEHMHGLRYALSYDTRDNVNYPYSGMIVKVSMDQMLGSDKQNIFLADYRQFFTLGDNVSNVLAVHAFGRFISADASRSFWSSYGRAGGIAQRGYETGRYNDRNLVNMEVEYRKETPWLNSKLGFVAAVSTGKVFGSSKHSSGMSKDFKDAEWLPAVAAGVRYRLLPYERLNLKFDYAYGKTGSVFYFGITESF
ncbi:BamA/TamA family outer membrane protein [Persicobacter diffluens]|uniref:Bacterial surface antigen (D15) domain-containing protein n=1 Tax=Persicobacter diffluens TaxID=981 RepID=A0AAN4VYC4_9BACT|nr:hypothetical protein PEDI_15890 [Persicobacter diffluens]